MIGFTATRAAASAPAPVETNFEDLLGLPAAGIPRSRGARVLSERGKANMSRIIVSLSALLLVASVVGPLRLSGQGPGGPGGPVAAARWCP